MACTFDSKKFHFKDLLSGMVVFLVALPLCLGIALASGAPIIAGIISGIVGGLLVGFLSGSHISVAGPAAGLTAVILVQLDLLGGNYAAFLLCVILAGLIQIAFGLFRLGFFANFIPSNVILGLLAAIGLILILGQIQYLFGLNHFTWQDVIQGAGEPITWDKGSSIIGIFSLLFMLIWDQTRFKTGLLPSALVVVILAVLLNIGLQYLAPDWAVAAQHLIQLPDIWQNPNQFFMFPDWQQLTNPVIYTGAVTLAVVASLETLLNLEAADKLDPAKRSSPPNRELWAQGVGNMVSGAIGGMPLTSVIVRSSVNASAGAKTKNSTIFHGLLLLLAVLLFVPLMNMIPLAALAALAAILILTGFKLTHPKLYAQLYAKGWKQFLPFIVTIIAILVTDLLVGILIGLAVSAAFILYGNFNKGIKIYREHHLHGVITRLELPSQVSFLNRSALISALAHIHRGEHVVIDATQVDDMDADIFQLIQEFQQETAQQRGIEVKLVGFKSHYMDAKDTILDIDISTAALQKRLTPQEVLTLLKAGNTRFMKNERLQRDIYRQLRVTAEDGQHPIAAVLGCMDSRAPTEMIFDVGIGDLFSLRIAGNIAGQKVLGSLEFACQAKGAKVIIVLGHTDCGAVTSACQLHLAGQSVQSLKAMPHIQYVLGPLNESVDCVAKMMQPAQMTAAFIEQVTQMNVHNNIRYILQQSSVLCDLVERGEILIVGAVYDVKTGQVNFLGES